MNKKPFSFPIFLSLLFFIACSGNPGSGIKATSVDEVRNILYNQEKSDEAFREQIVGTWTSYEMVRGETIVFDKDGKYSGYDGRDKYKGTWEIKDHKINLSLGGLFTLNILNDTLYMDALVYVRQAPELTESDK